MSKADEMFEKLGYKKIEHNIFKKGEEPKANEWITQDEPYIEYRDEEIIHKTYYSMFIMFMMTCKCVQIGGCEKGIKSDGTYYLIARNPILETDEVNAINEKCKELGWIK